MLDEGLVKSVGVGNGLDIFGAITEVEGRQTGRGGSGNGGGRRRGRRGGRRFRSRRHDRFGQVSGLGRFDFWLRRFLFGGLSFFFLGHHGDSQFFQFFAQDAFTGGEKDDGSDRQGMKHNRDH